MMIYHDSDLQCECIHEVEKESHGILDEVRVPHETQAPRPRDSSKIRISVGQSSTAFSHLIHLSHLTVHLLLFLT